MEEDSRLPVDNLIKEIGTKMKITNLLKYKIIMELMRKVISKNRCKNPHNRTNLNKCLQWDIMSELPSLKKLQQRLKTHQCSQDKQVKNLIIALQSLRLLQKQGILLRIQTKQIKIRSLYYHILENIAEPISLRLPMDMELMGN